MSSTFGRAGLIAGLASLIAAAPAAAHDVPFTEGTTTLKLSSTAAGALDGLGVRASGTRFEVVAGGIYSLHDLDEDGGGELRHKGTLTLSKGAVRVRISDPTIKVVRNTRRDRGSVSARVGGTRLRIGTLSLRRYKPTEGGGFGGASLRLSAKAAAALDAAFATTAFAGGLELGTLSSRGMAAPLNVTGGNTTVVLAPGAVQALTAAGASVAPIAPATGAGTAADPLRFPVAPSTFDYASFAGTFKHTGGLRLTFRDGTGFDVTDPAVEYKEELTLSTGQTPVFELRFDDDSTLRGGTRTEFGGLEVRFTKAAADLLAPKLGVSAATVRGLTVGTATLKARARIG